MQIDLLSTLETLFDSSSYEDFQRYMQQQKLKEKLKSPEQSKSDSPPQMQPEKGPTQLENIPDFQFQELSPQQKTQTMQSTFNGLNGLEVLRIYSDTPFFRQLLTNRDQYPRQIDQLLWRITYIVGQLLIVVQNQLIKENQLKDCFILSVSEISSMSAVMLQLSVMNQFQNSCELSVIKNMLLEVFKQGYCETEAGRAIYSFMVKHCLKKVSFVVEIQQEEIVPEKIIANTFVQTDAKKLENRQTLTQVYGEPKMLLPNYNNQDRVSTINIRDGPTQKVNQVHILEQSMVRPANLSMMPQLMKASQKRQIVRHRPQKLPQSQISQRVITTQHNFQKLQPYESQVAKSQPPAFQITSPYPALNIQRSPPPSTEQARNDSKQGSIKSTQIQKLTLPQRNYLLPPTPVTKKTQVRKPKSKAQQVQPKKQIEQIDNSNSYFNYSNVNSTFQLPAPYLQQSNVTTSQPHLYTSYANPSPSNRLDGTMTKRKRGRPVTYPDLAAQQVFVKNNNLTDLSQMKDTQEYLREEAKKPRVYNINQKRPAAPQWNNGNQSPDLIFQKHKRVPATNNLKKEQNMTNKAPEQPRKPMLMPMYSLPQASQSNFAAYLNYNRDQNNQNTLKMSHEPPVHPQPQKRKQKENDSIFVESEDEEEQSNPIKRESKIPDTSINDLYKNPASITPEAIPKCNVAFSAQNVSPNTQDTPVSQSPIMLMREKYTGQQQKLMASAFIETGDYNQCSQTLIDKYGNHPKYEPQVIEHRVRLIVRKVQQKFKNLQSKNESINKFKQNWEIISKCQNKLKRDIYRHIVTIYTAMLNMTEQKREIISNKIIQINRACQNGNN